MADQKTNASRNSTARPRVGRGAAHIKHEGNHIPNKLNIEWEAVRKLESSLVWKGRGKPQPIDESVHFHHRDFPEVGQVASAEGYMFHGKDAIKVYILEADAEALVKAGVDGKRLVAEVKKGVRQWFQQFMAGKIPLRGKIVGVING
jgi:hypothetical protein